MPVALVRKELVSLLDLDRAGEAHPGLLLQRGLAEHEEHGKRDKQSEPKKTKHAAKVCAIQPGDFYDRAFARWQGATSDARHFRSVTLALESRMFIGLAGGGMLETGCAISHSYGTPYIPGSSVKGVVRACAEERFCAADEAEGYAICDELFGAPPDRGNPAGLAGLIFFHDAWWVPRSAESPLVEEVVTTHHMSYYSNDGKEPATDFDSPVPNAQVAAQGAFLFVMAGPSAWLALAEKILVDALCTRGIGAKTRAGYGYFRNKPVQPAEPTCDWVDAEIAKLAKQSNASESETLRSSRLAEAWRELSDDDLKRSAFLDIRRRWQKEGWWDRPPSRAARRVKAIYDQYDDLT